jgi:hypothetical protein
VPAGAPDIFATVSRPKSRDGSVGIATGYGLDDGGSTVPYPMGAGNVSLHHRVQNGSGAHPASKPTGNGALSPVVNDRGVTPTTDLYLTPRLRIRGAVPTLRIRLHCVVLG